MTKTVLDHALTSRLREWLDGNPAYNKRGRFAKLEAHSDVPAQRWKDMYYERQQASKDMIRFVKRISTDDANWILTGVRRPIDGYPFAIDPPAVHEGSTMPGRFRWVVREMTSHHKADAFRYLAMASGGSVAEDRWASLLLGDAAPTCDEVLFVCSKRPHFSAWLITGSIAPQVNPGDADSVDAWRVQAQGA